LPTDVPTAFFSYSRDDSEFALQLAADLKTGGANVWLDQLDIEPGQRWARSVQEALTSSLRLLVILSPSSVTSTNVEDEVTFALEEHKTVIPVLYRDCKIPFQLRPFQYIDFRTDYARGLKVMLKTLGAKEHVAAAAVEAAPTPQQGQQAAPDADQHKRDAELATAKEEQTRERTEVEKRAQLEQQELEHEAGEEARLELELERQAVAERARQQQRARDHMPPEAVVPAPTGLIDLEERARAQKRRRDITSGLVRVEQGASGQAQPQGGHDATSIDLASFFRSLGARKIVVAIAVCAVLVVGLVLYRSWRPQRQEEAPAQEAHSQASSPPPAAEGPSNKPGNEPMPVPEASSNKLANGPPTVAETSSNKPASGSSTAADSGASQPPNVAKGPEVKAEAPKSSSSGTAPSSELQAVPQSGKKRAEVPKTSSTANKKALPAPRSAKSAAPSDTGGTGLLPPGADPKLTALYQRAVGGDTQAMSDLGLDYEKGLGVPSDYNKAAGWYRKAADGGNTSGMNRLGGLYQNGLGVQKDNQQAVSWFRKAADAGNSDGMIRLGFLYSNGLGVEKDYVQAAGWYRKAAAAGSPYAMSNLGFMYQNGYGVERDYAQAVAWYRKAAEGGAAPGMFNLGVMYENGYGVARDQQQAVNWYRQAAQHGFREANTALQRLGASPN